MRRAAQNAKPDQAKKTKPLPLLTGLLHVLSVAPLRIECTSFGCNPSSAQGIAAEIPQELRSNSEELERKAQFLRAGARKNAPILTQKSK
jgi:hypothetical protein